MSESVCSDEKLQEILVFLVAGYKFGLKLSQVKRVAPCPYISALPGAPTSIIGVINSSGEIVPVYDFWRRLGWSMPNVRADHKIVVTRSAGRSLAFVVDDIDDLLEASLADLARIVPSSSESPPTSGVIPTTTGSGIMVIEDVESFLTGSEQTLLDAALAARTE